MNGVIEMIEISPPTCVKCGRPLKFSKNFIWTDEEEAEGYCFCGHRQIIVIDEYLDRMIERNQKIRLFVGEDNESLDEHR